MIYLSRENLYVLITANAADNLFTLYGPQDQEINEKSLGFCHLCGEWRKLTREHVPPRAAFNGSSRLWHRMNSKGEGVAQVPIPTRCGFWIRALCSACNGDSPHAQEYVRFAKSLAEKPVLFSSSGRRRMIHIAEDTLLLAKEIVVMILAAEPLQFGKRHDDLRRFVLQDSAPVVPEFRVYGFLVPDRPESGTIVRSQSRIDGNGEGFDLMAGEISSFPFGFIYGWQIGRGYKPDHLTDITHWFSETSPELRRGRVESFDCRVTVIESLQAIYSGPRTGPQVDYIR